VFESQEAEQEPKALVFTKAGRFETRWKQRLGIALVICQPCFLFGIFITFDNWGYSITEQTWWFLTEAYWKFMMFWC